LINVGQKVRATRGMFGVLISRGAVGIVCNYSNNAVSVNFQGYIISWNSESEFLKDCDLI